MKMTNRRTEQLHSKWLIWPLLALFLFSPLLHGCAVQAPPSPVYYPAPQSVPQALKKEPAPYAPKPGPAAALYAQAETSLAGGNYRQAELELERALRIEPRNADYWYAMARVKYRQDLHKQAIQFCLKSKSLAGRNSDLIRLNDALIAEARQRQAN